MQESFIFSWPLQSLFTSKSQWKNPIGNQDDANFWVSDDGQKSVITAAPYSVPPTAKPKSCRKQNQSLSEPCVRRSSFYILSSLLPAFQTNHWPVADCTAHLDEQRPPGTYLPQEYNVKKNR